MRYADATSGCEITWTGNYGIRPTVNLYSGIITNKTKDTSFLGETCWALK